MLKKKLMGVIIILITNKEEHSSTNLFSGHMQLSYIRSIVRRCHKIFFREIKYLTTLILRLISFSRKSNLAEHLLTLT